MGSVETLLPHAKYIFEQGFDTNTKQVRDIIKKAVADADELHAQDPSAAHLLYQEPARPAFAKTKLNENAEVWFVAMRGPLITQAMLDLAYADKKRLRPGFGYATHATNPVAPPAPTEFVAVFERVRTLCGGLLDPYVLFSVICNLQKEEDKAKAGHVAHYDPLFCEAISVVNLGPGDATLQLIHPTTGHVVYEQTMKPGTACAFGRLCVCHVCFCCAFGAFVLALCVLLRAAASTDQPTT